MKMISVYVCPYCESQRNVSPCSWCSTNLIERKIELPELSSSEKIRADKYMVENKGTSDQTNL